MLEPTREIYWNIVRGGLIYGLAAVAAGFVAWGILRRYRLWNLGEGKLEIDRVPERLRGLAIEVFGHRRQLRHRSAGLAHLFIFYGFLAELIATGMIAVQEWTGVHYLKGDLYLAYSLLSDSFGILGLVGVGMAAWRRAVARPSHVHSVVDDWIALGLLALVFAQGFLVEGLRIAATELEQQPDLAPWSPGGYVVALALSGLSRESLEGLHRFSWWFHAITAFAFLAYMAFGKLKHAFFGLANIFLRRLDTGARLPFPDIDETLENDPDALETLGVERLEQYPVKGLLDLDACMQCGRCESVCPASLSGVPLSPRKLILDMRTHMTDVGPSLLARMAKAAADGDAGGDANVERRPLFGEAGGDGPAPAVTEEELWGCRTCGACQQECPVFIEHIPKMVDMRRYLVMTESKMSDGAAKMLKNLDDRMHPWVGAPFNRDHWYRDLDVKVLGEAEDPNAEYLFWVGCTGAMMERNIKVTQAIVKVLQAGGVDFAILGPEEVCTGDPARRVGGELTFQICTKQNIETLASYGVKKIITTCPHCFNTFDNEYPDFGGNYEVIHHSQLIAELIDSGRLELKRELDSVTYHDPCYLGRHNGVYEEPRRVIDRLSKNGVTEMARNRSKSLCCGAGGGYAWMDDDPTTRINHMRLEDVKACGAKTAAVSCPFCMQMFEDALSSKDPAKSIRAADIAELVAEALVEPGS